MFSSILGKYFAGKKLIWTGAAMLAIAVPAVGATTHFVKKASTTNRTPSHALVTHKATAKSASHAKTKGKTTAKTTAKPTAKSSAKSSSTNRPGYPLALAAVNSIHSGHASVSPIKSSASVKTTTTAHTAKKLSSTSHM